MRHSPISLENGPLKSVQNVKKWPIGNFKIIKKAENGPGSVPKIRVGRRTVNTPIFFLA